MCLSNVYYLAKFQQILKGPTKKKTTPNTSLTLFQVSVGKEGVAGQRNNGLLNHFV